MERLQLILCVLWVSVSVCDCEVLMYGHVQSPLYPKPYPADLQKQWNLEVPHGYRIKLTFSYLDIEHSTNCTSDSLMVLYDRKVLGKFCGQRSTDAHHPGLKSILSPGNRLQLVFVTDSSNPDLQPHLGFSAFYQAIVINCGDPRPLLNGGVRFLSGSNNEYRSLIQYHCNEPYYTFKDAHHVNFSCAADCKWRDSDENAVIPPCYPVCGRPTVSLSERERVMGGKVAPAGAFPWQVFLRTRGRSGAIVIGDRWLMTAAHNLERVNFTKENVMVYVGDVLVSEIVKHRPLPVSSLHVHPEYKNNDMCLNFDNDIALIKLSSPITFNSNVMPVCLPPQDTELEHVGWVSGFGLTETYMASNKLLYIKLPIVDQGTCHTFVETERAIHEDIGPLTDNMFCAGLPEGGEDTCIGDTGSAFVTKKNNTYWVAGIVSWGVECAKPGKYGIYTHVSKYTNWIQKTMEENQ
ncbi:complement C1r subcomponent-like [Astyanax mexicanus]|uniref:Complement C1r subcomponent-like n=1 Tax=Astyanax mexicanus TaxID=7994 RepID=A0A8T2M3X6_ASTMX|nr:complement C1r subcomponent-like [Astyanax mexicanus]